MRFVVQSFYEERLHMMLKSLGSRDHYDKWGKLQLLVVTHHCIVED